jgi:outer membrane protein OmpA-like peptidoglycan-associated protein
MVKAVLTILVLAISLISFGQEYEITKVKTGLKGNVYAPVQFEDKIIVCSDQKSNMKITYLDASNRNTNELYILDTTDFKATSVFDQRFSSALHDGPIAFGSKNQFAAVSKNQLQYLKGSRLEKANTKLGIYFSNKKNGKWQLLNEFTYNDTSYNITHPALSEDGKTLYFASDMPGGFGSFDIYKSSFTNGEWTKPTNLGAEVNTDKGEVFPTVIGGNIYFSSNRGSKPDLDVYKHSEGNEAVLLPAPINSDANDFHLTSTDNLGTAFLSSDRGGMDEIYKLNSLFPTFDNCTELTEVSFCYLLEEENAMSFDDTPGLIYEWDIQGVKKRGISVDYCFPGFGEYDIYLNVIDTIVDQIYFEQNYFHLSLEETEQAYISSANAVAPNEKFLVSAERTNISNLNAEGYYWTFDDGTHLKGITAEHKISTEGPHSITLGIISKDDGTKYCVTKQINCTEKASSSLERLNPTEHNIASTPNGDSDSTYLYSIEALKSDSIINDKAFRVGLEKYGNVRIKYIEEEKSYMYLVGEFKNIEQAHPVWKELKKDGFENAEVKPFTKSELDDFQIDKAFVLENLQFDEGSWQIKPLFEKDLKLIRDILLQNKDLNMLIEAFTDASGAPEYNLNLSKKRANAVKDYLAAAGIEAERITSRGLGEANPIASNTTEDGKQKNRRVEFTLLK